MVDEVMQTEMPTREYAGFCRFCRQARMVHGPDGWNQAQIDNQATAECDCEGASFERRQQQRLDAALAWAKNMFDSEEQADLQLLMTRAIIAVFTRGAKAVSVTADGKNTYKIAMDSNDMLRVRKEFREQDEEEF